MVVIDKQMFVMFVLLGILIAVLVVPSFQLKNMQEYNTLQNKQIIDNTNRNFEDAKSFQSDLQTSNDRRTNNTLFYMAAVFADLEEDLDLLVKNHNLSNTDRITNNGTHIIIDHNARIPLIPNSPPGAGTPALLSEGNMSIPSPIFEGSQNNTNKTETAGS